VFERLRYRRADGSVFLYAFDLLELDGADLRREPLETRGDAGEPAARVLGRTAAGRGEARLQCPQHRHRDFGLVARRIRASDNSPLAGDVSLALCDVPISLSYARARSSTNDRAAEFVEDLLAPRALDPICNY